MLSERQQLCVEQVKRNVVDCIYSSAKIEGIAVTFPETQQLYDGINVPNLSVQDVVKINNLKHAWQFVFDSLSYPLDLSYLRQLNQIVNAGLMSDAGMIRTYDVTIGGTSWKPVIPDYDILQGDISYLMAQPDTVDRAVSVMLYVMRCQIFSDGNKRVAQLAANQILIQNGCGYLKLPTEHIDVFYQKLIAYYETNDPSDISEYVKETSIFTTQPIRQQQLPPISEEMFLDHARQPEMEQTDAPQGPYWEF